MELNGDDLSCYSNKIESVSLTKCPCNCWLTNKVYVSAVTVTNISRSFTYKMAAEMNWHRPRYGTKLRHCHRMYSIWPNLDSDSQWIRIWIHWHIERYGFVNVVECDAIVVCLCWWCWCDVILLLSISGFATESVYLDLCTEWTFSLNPTQIQTRIRQIEYGICLCEHFCLLLVEEQLQHLYCSICCKWNRNKKHTCQ